MKIFSVPIVTAVAVTITLSGCGQNGAGTSDATNLVTQNVSNAGADDGRRAADDDHSETGRRNRPGEMSDEGHRRAGRGMSDRDNDRSNMQDHRGRGDDMEKNNPDM